MDGYLNQSLFSFLLLEGVPSKALLNSLSVFPAARPSSGNFFGPKINRAKITINNISPKPKLPIKFTFDFLYDYNYHNILF